MSDTSVTNHSNCCVCNTRNGVIAVGVGLVAISALVVGLLALYQVGIHQLNSIISYSLIGGGSALLAGDILAIVLLGCHSPEKPLTSEDDAFYQTSNENGAHASFFEPRAGTLIPDLTAFTLPNEQIQQDHGPDVAYQISYARSVLIDDEYWVVEDPHQWGSKSYQPIHPSTQERYGLVVKPRNAPSQPWFFNSREGLKIYLGTLHMKNGRDRWMNTPFPTATMQTLAQHPQVQGLINTHFNPNTYVTISFNMLYTVMIVFGERKEETTFLPFKSIQAQLDHPRITALRHQNRTVIDMTTPASTPVTTKLPFYDAEELFEADFILR